MRQVVRVPASQAREFDVTVDVAIRPKGSYDAVRAHLQLRSPLNVVRGKPGKIDLVTATAGALVQLLEEGVDDGA